MITISFFLLLRKGIYPYECIDDWEKFNEKSLYEKEDFYSHLNIEDITYGNYAHAKRVCKEFEIKNLGGYHDLYVQSICTYLRSLEICVLKYMRLILQNFFQLLN